MALHSDWKEFLLCFNGNRVRFVVVGAHALAAHGQPRFTGDLDVLVEASESNARRMLAALKEFGKRSCAQKGRLAPEPAASAGEARPPFGSARSRPSDGRRPASASYSATQNENWSLAALA